MAVKSQWSWLLLIEGSAELDELAELNELIRRQNRRPNKNA